MSEITPREYSVEVYVETPCCGATVWLTHIGDSSVFCAPNDVRWHGVRCPKCSEKVYTFWLHREPATSD